MSNANRLHSIAIDRATDRLGKKAWSIVGWDIRCAFIAQEILIILAGQDEDMDPAAFRKLADDLYDSFASLAPINTKEPK